MTLRAEREEISAQRLQQGAEGVETWMQRVEPPTTEGYSQAFNPHRVCQVGFQNFRESVTTLLFLFSLFGVGMLYCYPRLAHHCNSKAYNITCFLLSQVHNWR